MSSERTQLYYTCLFLGVSFQAIQQSVSNTPRREDSPCWLDAQMISMLHSELQRCRRQAAPFKPIHQGLDSAIYHCGLLMAQCPAALNRKLCQHHLDAILAPLQAVIAELAGKASHPAAAPGKPPRRWRWW